MVRTDGRRVDRRHAVLQDPNAILAQTSNDRPARARRKAGRADARLAVQGLADGGLESKLELFTGEDGNRLGLFKKVAAQRRGADNDASVVGYR
jgi:hypothetical protein